MVRPELPESARVRIELAVSEIDAARIDEVVTRPEFAGWTRGEWCVEIIRTALRYYVGDAPAGAGSQHAVAPPVAGQTGSPATPPPNQAATTPAPAPEPLANPGPVANPQPAAGFQPGPAAEAGTPRECAHPAGARDYETGTCAACGAILWD
jgi:hypothetical protein